MRDFLWSMRSVRCVRRARQGGVAAVGDSLTRGASVPGLGILGRHSWFSHAITDGGLPYSGLVAEGGATTAQITELLPEAIARRPRVLVLLAGFNDLGRAPQSDTLSRIRSMIQAVSAAGVVPVLGTLPQPLGVDEMNAGLRSVAADEQAAVIEFAASVSGDWRAYFEPSGVHPNAVGARLMGRAAIPILRRALSS